MKRVYSACGAWVDALAALAILIVLVTGAITGQALTQQDEKRTFQLLDCGYRLPIEILAIRNSQNEHWVRDLEIEIKNTSGSPVYEVYLQLELPDDNHGSAGTSLSIPLQYGRFDLMHPSQRPSTDDTPISPGKTVVLKVDEKHVRGYEHHLIAHDVPAQAGNKVRVVVLAINLGNGTGFINGGLPYPGNPTSQRPRPRYVAMNIN